MNGKLYDSKAIIGYAHGVSGDRAWRAADFSGGEKTVPDRWRAISQERPEAIKPQSCSSRPRSIRSKVASDFRNPAGVERKTGDLVSCLSGRRRTNGNRLDLEVVDAFQARPAVMREEAQAIEVALCQ